MRKEKNIDDLIAVGRSMKKFMQIKQTGGRFMRGRQMRMGYLTQIDSLMIGSWGHEPDINKKQQRKRLVQ